MPRQSVSSVAVISQPSGMETPVYLVLEKKPIRINQKLKTLSQYIEKYPSGWKKRLKLANLLYETGSWQQAIEQYRRVIERQPQVVEVYLRLGKILQLMAQPVEAARVYEQGLSHVRDKPTQGHIRGLIAVCNQDLEGAVRFLESAAALEPENPSHWLALGRVQMERNLAEMALQAYDRILARYPDDIVAAIERYDTLIALGNVGEARSQLNQLIELAPYDVRVLQRQDELH
ncbi:tetratricopeptide repeat protein [Roseofilum sp. Guam]|uniref:tetratricopeptide repeat protein n=1 Tax=Roseofilum sp. Guam TaxID=2821502 RepID=UPI00298DC33C|nr:tetratricopeptide repeat protein [Roseofilum sp. Guam]